MRGKPFTAQIASSGINRFPMVQSSGESALPQTAFPERLNINDIVLAKMNEPTLSPILLEQVHL